MRLTKLTLTTAVMAMLGTGLAAAMGACSDPFSSVGYTGGGGDDDGGSSGPLDATTPPGTEAGAGGKDGGTTMDAAIGIKSVDGITDTVCTPQSCQGQSVECGDASDGCGRRLDCGVCQQYGYTCNGGTCGCTPLTVAAGCTGLCGDVPDGCGGFINCGSPCGSGDSCGPANVCMAGGCTTGTDPQNACGTISNGCGGTKTAGGSCPTNNLNNACNNGDAANRCGCYGSSCGQQGYACSIPGSPPVGDRCQDPTYQCSGCTYPPGQCTTNHLCNSCTRVAAPAWPYDAQCKETALTEAWACDCADGGTCTVPDGFVTNPQTCTHLLDTSAHGIYCCMPQD